MRKNIRCNPTPPGLGILCTSSDNYDCIVYPHYHLGYELSIALSGVHALTLEECTMRLQPGTIVLLRPSEAHSREMEVAGKHITIEFPASEVAAMAQYLGDGFPAQMLSAERPPMAVLPPEEVERYTRRIERVNLFHATDAPRATAELRALLIDLCFYHLAGAYARASARPPWLKKLLSEMDAPENLRRGLPAMLEIAPYSHEYLCREFRRMMGQTPTEYINAARLSLAQKLLEGTQRDIVDICYAVGFESVSYFYHLFRSRLGTTPNRYRKEHRVAYPGRAPEQRTAAE